MPALAQRWLSRLHDDRAPVSASWSRGWLRAGDDLPHRRDEPLRRHGPTTSARPAPGMRLAGPAVTVRVPPGDNLMVYKAFEIAQPGRRDRHRVRGYTAVAQWGDLN